MKPCVFISGHCRGTVRALSGHCWRDLGLAAFPKPQDLQLHHAPVPPPATFAAARRHRMARKGLGPRFGRDVLSTHELTKEE